jgi:hypothetical protein
VYHNGQKPCMPRVLGHERSLAFHDGDWSGVSDR